MAELAQKLLRYARLPARAARLTLGEPGSALLALRMACWVAALSLLFRLMPLPRALKLVAPRARGARPRNPAEVQERLGGRPDSPLAAGFPFFTPACWEPAPALHRYP